MDLIEERRQKEGRGCARRITHITVALFFCLAAPLNGPALLREAELLPYGRYHDVCVSAAKPLAAAAEWLRLDRPRAGIERFAERFLSEP